jgi:hypothetical protein
MPAGMGVWVDRSGAVACYRHWGYLLWEAERHITFQHPGIKRLYLSNVRVSYR